MIYVALALVLPFIENFLWGLGLGSILIVLVYYLYISGRMSTLLVIVFSVFAIFMDLSLHIPLGTLLISLCVGLLVLFGISMVVPIKDSVTRIPILLFVFFLTHMVVGLLAHRQGWGNAGEVLGLVFGPSLRFALFDVVIYLVIDYF